MSKSTDRNKRHKFTALPEFDRAMRKLSEVPKEEIDRREEAERTPRKEKR